MNFNAEYLNEVRRGLRGYKRMAEGAIAQLSREELFRQIDPEANSVAIIMKHISGNMRSRFTDFLTSDGEKLGRHRDQEFVQDRLTSEELMNTWESEWQRLFATIEALQPEDLGRSVTIRGEEHTVLQALNRALLHYAQHIGQIIFLAKHIRGADWKSLSIPRGKSEEYKTQSPGKYSKGMP
ncbi:MAG TPA: DUF1572 family protein [Terriglobales bacterium]|jgi:hypothetical protein|nr:DUF1572 family protein [Terriglobales bacterium]